MPTIQEILTDIRSRVADAPTPELFAPVIEQNTIQQYQRNQYGAVLRRISVPAAGGKIMQDGNNNESE